MPHYIVTIRLDIATRDPAAAARIARHIDMMRVPLDVAHSDGSPIGPLGKDAVTFLPQEG